MEKNKTSVKVSDDAKSYLKRGCANYFLQHNREITLSTFLEITAKYFKANDDRYIELLTMEVTKNGS